MNNRLFALLLTLLPVVRPASAQAEELPAERAAADTTIVVDRVQVTAIKQGMALRSLPAASAIVGSREIERGRVDALKSLSETVPNLHLPDYGSRITSSIYVRGLGARIDQPVVGLNIDNVPVMQKNAFDVELADAERIEVLRGPQSTLYGRNTMGGVINVYTRSPLQYEGVRIGMEYASGDTYKFRASAYQRLRPDWGISATAFYNRSNGFFRNRTTGERCDWERMGGGRLKLEHRRDDLRVENTFAFSVLDQGGYPYAYVGPDIEQDGRTVIGNGEIAYNDPCGYRRTELSDGLTVRYDAARFSVSSITGYRYSDDAMTLDQDFLPLSYFTLRQALREHSITEDLVVRSHDGRRYGWLVGAFGFYRHGTMQAPVRFKQTGVDELIFGHANGYLDNIRFEKVADELLLASDFRMPSYGGALYHESRFTAGRWHFTAGVRFDVEHTALHYRSRGDLEYLLYVGEGDPFRRTASVDDRNRLSHTYTELLPKFTALYAFDDRRNLYVTVAKGYKAGGFNTQLFSDILQEKLKWAMVSPDGGYREQDILSYRPEYSWNYEFGGHFSCMEGAVRGDFALFYIDCRDQQLTVFPEGTSTGRMMTNAGQTRSWGGEAALQCTVRRTLEVNAAYGYTDARFVRYDDGRQDFSGNYVPYAPQHTLSLAVVKTVPTGVGWLGDLVLRVGMRGTGRIRWNEENTLVQPFYTLFDASVRIEHPRYTLDFWGRNFANKGYDVFYFKSIGHEFVQRGRPRTFGITLNLNIQTKRP